MSRVSHHVFDVDHLLDVPAAGRRAVLLTVRADLDLATEERARAEIAEPAVAAADAVLLDLTPAFVGVSVIRCLHDVGAGSRPLAVIGAPRWLPDLSGLLGVAPLPYVRTAREATAVLRAAVLGPVPRLPGCGRRGPLHVPACPSRRTTGA
jgi:hypothetical protein